MELATSPGWLREQSTDFQLGVENASSAMDVFDSSTESFCQVCSYVKTLPRNIFVLQLLFPIVTLAANLLTTVAIYRSRQMKASFRLNLLHLSFTDIVSSVTYIYNIAFSWTQFEINLECVVRYVLFVLTQILTLVTIQFMSIDRCLALITPYLHARVEGATYVKVTMAINWTFTCVMAVVGFSHIDLQAEGCFYPLLFRPFTHAFWSITGTFAIANIVVLNIILLAKARKQIHKIATTMPVGEVRDREMSRLGIKSALTTVSVVVPYVLLNTPIYALMAVFVKRGPSFTHHSAALFLINAFSSLTLLNALVNPAVYIWRSELVRREIWKILAPLKSLGDCRKCKKSKREGEMEITAAQDAAHRGKATSFSSGTNGADTQSTRTSVDCSTRIARDFGSVPYDCTIPIPEDDSSEVSSNKIQTCS